MERFRVKRVCLLFTISTLLTFGAAPQGSPASDLTVVRLDPALESLISPKANLEVVRDGFGFTERINWIQKGKQGYLLFSDIPANVIDKMTADGKVSVFLDQSGYHGPWNAYTMLTVGGLSNNGKD